MPLVRSQSCAISPSFEDKPKSNRQYCPDIVLKLASVISRPEHAAALKGKADGVVVGSALVTLHHEGGVQAAAGLVRAGAGCPPRPA